MADPKDTPQPDTSVDATSDDPQGQAAANGMSAIWNSQPVQDAVSGKNQLDNYNMAVAAAKGDPNARQAMAEQQAQVAMGSIEVPRGPAAAVGDLIDQTVLPVAAPAGATAQVLDQTLIPVKGQGGAELLDQTPWGVTKPKPFGQNFADGGEVDPNVIQYPDAHPQAPEADAVHIYDISGQQPVLGTIHPDEVTQAVASGRYSLPQGSPVNVISPDGVHGTLDPTEAPQAFQSGYKYATPAELAAKAESDKYSTTGQQALAGLEGAAKGATFGLSPAAEMASGLTTNQDILKRQQYNPGTEGLGQVAGLAASSLIPGVGEANLLEHAGQAAAGAVGLGAAEDALAKIGSSAIKAATENLIFQGSDETAKMILRDPNQSVETAVTDMGLATMLGAGVGGAFGAAAPLWRATMGSKTGGVLKAVTDRLGGNEGVTSDAVNSAISTLGVDVKPEVRAAMATDPAIQNVAKALEQTDVTAGGREYQQSLKDFHSSANEALAGALGRTPEEIKSGNYGRSPYEAGQDVQKTLIGNLKENIDPISQQFEDVKSRFKGMELPADSVAGPGTVSEIADKISSTAADKGWVKSPSSDEMQMVNRVMKELPLQTTLNDLRNFQSTIAEEANRKQLYHLGSTFRTIFRDAEDGVVTKALGDQAPELLEKHQAARAAYKDAMGTVDSLNDALHVGRYNGPGSFIKAVGEMKPEDVIRRLSAKGDVNLMNLVAEKFPQVAEMVRNYHLDGVLKQAVDGAQPGQLLSPGKLLRAIDKMSPELRESVLPQGAKAKLEALEVLQEQLNKVPHNASNTARTLQGKISDMAGSAAGFATMLAGHNPVTAAIVGKLTQYLGKDVPDAARLALLKFVGSNQPIESEGFKTMVDFIQHTKDGENALSKGVSTLFKAGREVLPQSMMPTAKDRKQIDEHVKGLQVDASPLFNVGGKISHYMPETGQAMAQTAQTVSAYLNAARPNTDRARPLDTKMPPDPVKQAAYNRKLDIAQQPLILLNEIKKGTLTSHDVLALKAMYPSLYQSMTQKITNEIIQSTDKGKTVPYSTRVSLSLFTGEPLDSTMTAQAIMAAQPPQQQPGTPTQPPSSPKSSTKSLGKLPSMYSTPAQARQERAAKS